jgi:hypothetical protein
MKVSQNKSESNQINTSTDSQQQNKNNDALVQLADDRPEAISQRKFQEMADNSQQVKQLKVMHEMTNNHVTQRMGPEEEEPLQGKFTTIQKVEPEEEEPLQGKFTMVQKKEPEEEELLQGKFSPVQMKGPEEEELLQGKFSPVQMKGPEEEELLQGKFNPVQKKENNTGLPDNLKNGIESMSGISMDPVKVHYNSSQPAQLNALAYAQGTDIHVGPGQEQHLPHEAWHVVQQAQGRVEPTMQMKDGVPVNDDEGLENEADVMGAKAFSVAVQHHVPEEGNIDQKDPRAVSYHLPVQAMMSTSVLQLERTVTSSQARNMKAALARMFGGTAADYKIDQESGSIFNDNNGRDTTGHHGIKVTDLRDGSQYTCDFHDNGRYYTRG